MSTATKDSSISSLFPATLIPDAWMTDQRLERIATNALDGERIRCERGIDGKIRIYPPCPMTTWLMMQKVHTALGDWIQKSKRQGCASLRRRFFFEQSKLMLCPDLAYFDLPRGKSRLDIECSSKLTIRPGCVIEFCSHPKELRSLKDKMLQWIANGVELGWLMVPQEECVFVYSPGAEPEIVDGDLMVGEGPIDEFFMLLNTVWDLDVYRRRY